MTVRVSQEPSYLKLLSLSEKESFVSENDFTYGVHHKTSATVQLTVNKLAQLTVLVLSSCFSDSSCRYIFIQL